MTEKKLKVVMAEFSDVRFDARVLKSAQVLTEAGHQVSLLMYNESLQEDRERFEGGLSYREYAFPERGQTGSPRLRLKRLVKAGAVVGKIACWILCHRADVYHAHNLYFLWCSVLAAKLYRGKVVYDAHELHSEHYPGAEGRLVNGCNALYEKLLLPHCAVFIQASEERADYIAGKYRIARPQVINNYVPTAPYPGRSDRIRHECTLGPEARILFYSGGVYSGGGRRIDVVIAALQQLPDTHLVVVGFMNQDIRNRLSAEARAHAVQDRLHLLPPCRPAEIIDYAASADVGVIPLAGESLNTKMSALNKVSEYLMAGLPIACSSYPNLETLMRDNPVGPVGETFDVGSSDSVAGAIRSVLARSGRENFRGNALQLAHSFMNWEREKEKLRAIYAGLWW